MKLWIFFYLTIFSKAIFSEKNGEKQFSGYENFLEDLSYAKNEYKRFYNKLDDKYFHVKPFSRKNNYFKKNLLRYRYVDLRIYRTKNYETSFL